MHLKAPDYTSNFPSESKMSLSKNWEEIIVWQAMTVKLHYKALQKAYLFIYLTFISFCIHPQCYLNNSCALLGQPKYDFNSNTAFKQFPF